MNVFPRQVLRRLGQSAAAACLAVPLAAALPPRAVSGAPTLPGAVLEGVAFSALEGWDRDDHDAALAAFRRGCRAAPPPRPPPALAGRDPLSLCPAALAHAGPAQAFFERWFTAHRVVRPPPEGAEGFLTGYFEPEVPGSLTPGPGFQAPLLSRPPDLVSLTPGEVPAGLDPALRGARRRADGGLEPYPDRAAIEDGAVAGLSRPLVYLRDAVEVFVMQVQGSGRVRLADGTVLRAAYDGRNGRPYTSIGRLIVQEGHLPLEGLTLARWTSWLRANPATARDLMRRNASYVFFRIDPALDPATGPTGGSGAALTAGRSLAVDAGLWPYGMPVWLEGALPRPEGGTEPLARLTIAQDTGSAIVGPARGDLFVGSGAAAGVAAGLIRHRVGFVVLLPGAGP